MPAPVFGRIDKPEQLNLDPFKFKLIGYRRIDGEEPEEVEYEFTASGVQPFYSQLDIVRAAAAGNGLLATSESVNFIELSLVDDAERARFRETLETPNVFFESSVIGEIQNWLLEEYSGRPTRPRTARRSGASRGGRRSPGAAGAKASRA